MESAGLPLFSALSRLYHAESARKLHTLTHTGVARVSSTPKTLQKLFKKNTLSSGTLAVSLVFLVLQELSHEVQVG